MLPFPPRVFAKEYLALNPLGTIPFMIDGETKMTESSGICHYLGTRYGPTPLMVGVDDPAYGAFLNWMYFSDATLTFPQTLVLRYSQLEPEERRNPQVADRLRQMVPRPVAGGRSRRRQSRNAVRRSVHRGRYRDRLRACGWPKTSGWQRISGPTSPPTGSACSARWIQAGRRRGRTRRRAAEGREALLKHARRARVQSPESPAFPDDLSR